jgi:plastocyanin
VIWWVRAGFTATILALLVLAGWTYREHRRASSPPPDELAMQATQPVVTPTPRPTATPQSMISRMARTTPTVPTRPPGAATGAPSISISDAGFAPAELRVQVGRSVTWRNDGLQSHDVSPGGPAEAGWDSGLLGPSGTFSRVFTTPGQYDYVCRLHTVMRGRIIVEP